MSEISEAFASFAQKDEGAAALRQRFLESPEFQKFVAGNEVMNQFNPS
jgi:hypothetical protein